jgi:hypothetical protein
MSIWTRMRSALSNLAHRQSTKDDLDAEVRACSEMPADENMAEGMPEWEARRRALAELGGTERVKQGARRAGRNWRGGFVAGRAVWIAAAAPFAGVHRYGAADRRDGSWRDHGDVQHRGCRNPEASAFCATRPVGGCRVQTLAIP